MDDGPDNPYGNGWTVKDTPLSTEATSQRVCNAETARYWKISNPASKHAITGAQPNHCHSFQQILMAQNR